MSGLGEEMVRTLQEAQETIDEKLQNAELRLFSTSQRAITAADVEMEEACSEVLFPVYIHCPCTCPSIMSVPVPVHIHVCTCTCT
jgi:hypothetical protein